jgi:hypothetical protein
MGKPLIFLPSPVFYHPLSAAFHSIKHLIRDGNFFHHHPFLIQHKSVAPPNTP